MKKETLEEAFNKIVDSSDYVLFDYASFEEGAKWQQERSYSEEDMKESWYNGMKSDNGFFGSFEEWFKQFKNK
jgi:hypothetical protein